MEVKLGIGETIVTVPENAALEIDAHAGAGEVDVLGEVDEGTGAGARVSIPGSTADAPVLDARG